MNDSCKSCVTVAGSLCRMAVRWRAAAILLIACCLFAPAASGAPKKAPRLLKYNYQRCENETPSSVATLLGVSVSDLAKWNRKALSGRDERKFKKTAKNIVYYAGKPFARESIGRPNAGSLAGGMNLDCDGDDRGLGWVISVHRKNMYGTPETIRNIHAAARAYRKYFVDRKQKYVPLAIGDLSGIDGGPFPPHVSHQSGRDVDIGVLRTSGNEPGKFGTANRDNLDVLRTWVMLKSFLDTGDVKYIFIHKRLADEIRTYVKKIYRGNRSRLAKYDREFGPKGVIRGDTEHSSHVHIRFNCARGDKRCIP